MKAYVEAPRKDRTTEKRRLVITHEGRKLKTVTFDSVEEANLTASKINSAVSDYSAVGMTITTLPQLADAMGIAGLAPASEEITLAEYLQTYNERHRDIWAPNSRAAYATYQRTHIAPDLGHLPLRDGLTVEILRNFVTGLRGKGLAASTVDCIATHVLSVLRYASEEDKVDRVPARRQVLPKALKTQDDGETGRGWTESQRSRLLAVIEEISPNERVTCYFRVLDEAGLRPSEAAGLRVVDIDWKTGEVTVRGQFHYEYRDVTKTRQARKSRVSQQLLERLRRLRSANDARAFERGRQSSEWLFEMATTGRPHTQTAMRALLKRAARKAGVPLPKNHSLHQLRHTAISRWIDDADTNVYAIAARSGHATPGHLFKQYGQAYRDREAARTAPLSARS
ncbi:MAG: tyrosine-type recombinase/integrase [Acidobacteria bacterium]|nr:tyrosine-type recombinase/integrase [Acidobacteriota bacterium]